MGKKSKIVNYKEEFFKSCAALCSEIDMPEERLEGIIRDSFDSALKKELYSYNNIEILVNIKEKILEINLLYEIVEEIKLRNEEYFSLMTIEDAANKGHPDAVVGETIKVEIPIFDESGATGPMRDRGFTQGFQQLFIQKVNEVQKENIYKKFKPFENKLYKGKISHMEYTSDKYKANSGVYSFIRVKLDDKVESNLEGKDILSNYKFRNGDDIVVYIKRVEDVRAKDKEKRVIISQTDPGFVEAVLRETVPEIADGTVIIKKVVRRAGILTKVAVDTTDPNVDPVTSCLGRGNQRLQSVKKEIGDEQVSFVRYYDNIEKYVIEAFKQVEVYGIAIDSYEEKRMTVIFSGEQYNSSEGRGRMNLSLARELTGWNLETKKTEDAINIHYKRAQEIMDAEEIIPVINEEESEIQQLDLISDDIVEPITPINTIKINKEDLNIYDAGFVKEAEKEVPVLNIEFVEPVEEKVAEKVEEVVVEKPQPRKATVNIDELMEQLMGEDDDDEDEDEINDDYDDDELYEE
jgi:N utilization substance protein A